jgi:hypothetical protein
MSQTLDSIRHGLNYERHMAANVAVEMDVDMAIDMAIDKHVYVADDMWTLTSHIFMGQYQVAQIF